MHHPTDRIAHTTTFAIPVVEHQLDKKQLNVSTPRDRSDDPSHHEQTLYHRVTSSSYQFGIQITNVLMLEMCVCVCVSQEKKNWLNEKT